MLKGREEKIHQAVCHHGSTVLKDYTRHFIRSIKLLRIPPRKSMENIIIKKLITGIGESDGACVRGICCELPSLKFSEKV